jgi:CIC family chloride channel protein
LYRKIGRASEKYFLYYVNSEMFRYLVHIVLSVILGLLAGGGGVLFHSLLEFMRFLFEGQSIKHLGGLLGDYYIVLVPVMGALMTASMRAFYPELGREQGVITVIKAIILRKGLIPLRETVFHFFAPIISIGTGAPLGPEGPSARIGSGIGSLMSQVFRLNRNDMVMYTAAGAGAAISAVFNAPIAGVFFGIEVVLLNDLRNRALSALIISSVVADIKSRAFLGNARVFTIPHYSLGDVYAAPFYFGLALFCGILALLYFAMLDSMKSFFSGSSMLRNPLVRILPVALVFGFVLSVYPTLYGIGYSTINDVLNAQIPPADVAFILGFKMVFLVLFLAAGGFGGSFAPSLSLGAFGGYLFAVAANGMFSMNLDPTAFALVGMGGCLSAINSIPLTSILLVFEITNDYKFILPLMLASVISYLVVIYYKKGTVYTLELMNAGIDVSRRGEMDILGRIHVSSIVRRDMETVDYSMPFRKLMDIIINSRYGDVFVVDGRGGLRGIITLKGVRQALLDNDLADLLIAGDLLLEVPAVKEEDPLTVAIQKMKLFEIENIPVVSPDHEGRLVGIITHRDIIHAYERILNDLDDSESITGRGGYSGRP